MQSIAIMKTMVAYELIKPKKLQRGDYVAAVSLSWGGPATFPHRYQSGVRQLEATFGLEVVAMPHTCKDAQFLKQHPEARAADLMQAFADERIAAIFSTIGGDDSIRILPYLDLDVIRENPKVFMGYSDTTITHMAMMQAGVASFYGPSIMAGFAENLGMFSYTIDAIERTLFQSGKVGDIRENKQGWTNELLDWGNSKNQGIKRTLYPPMERIFLQGKGIHSGRLLGGCLEVLDWMRGATSWPPQSAWKGAILFIETSEEAPTPTRVKRILRSFAAAGVLQELSGLLVGRPGGDIKPSSFGAYDQAILEVVRGELGLEELPIVSRMDFGHTDPMGVLPIGVNAVIDCSTRSIRISENAVTD